MSSAGPWNNTVRGSLGYLRVLLPQARSLISWAWFVLWELLWGLHWDCVGASGSAGLYQPQSTLSGSGHEMLVSHTGLVWQTMPAQHRSSPSYVKIIVCSLSPRTSSHGADFSAGTDSFHVTTIRDAVCGPISQEVETEARGEDIRASHTASLPSQKDPSLYWGLESSDKGETRFAARSYLALQGERQ